MRLDAYVGFLAAESHAFNKVDLSTIIANLNPQAKDYQMVLNTLLEGRAAETVLNSALAALSLVAPRDTQHAAVAVMTAVLKSARTDAGDGSDHQEKRTAFLKLAQRDLGLPAP